MVTHMRTMRDEIKKTFHVIISLHQGSTHEPLSRWFSYEWTY